MRKVKSCFVVLSRNAGSLFGYAEALNKLGYYSVSLCARVCEIIDMLEAGASFEYLFYDDFDLGKDANHLQMLGKHNAISSIIAVSDVNSEQGKKLFCGRRLSAYRFGEFCKHHCAHSNYMIWFNRISSMKNVFLLTWGGSRR